MPLALMGAVALGAPSAASAAYPLPFTVSVQIDAPGAASGTVDSSPAGIDCPDTCMAMFPALMASADLVAHHAAGTRFDHWSGAPCDGSTATTCTVSDDADVTARFAKIQHTLTVTVAGPGHGRRLRRHRLPWRVLGGAR